MNNLKLGTWFVSFVGTLVTFAALFFIAMAFSGCKTLEPTVLPGCDSVVNAQVTASINQGYKVVQTQDSPAGQMAALVNAEQAKARIYYVTPVAGAVDYLTQHGWTKAAECTDKGQTIYMLQRDVEIPLTPGKQARN